MTATLKLYLDHGGSDGSPSSTDIDSLSPNLRFKCADDASIDTANPLVKPNVGTNYSYAKNCYIKCTVAPALLINNIQIYSDGANGLGTGVDCLIGQQFPTRNSGSTAAYKKATGTSSSGTVMTSLYSGVITSTASVFTYTSSSPLSISISESSSQIDAINETTNYFVLQMSVGTTASSIDLTPTESLTISYDEI